MQSLQHFWGSRKCWELVDETQWPPEELFHQEKTETEQNENKEEDNNFDEKELTADDGGNLFYQCVTYNENGDVEHVETIEGGGGGGINNLKTSRGFHCKFCEHIATYYNNTEMEHIVQS